MNQINLLLENQDVEAIDGVTFDRLNPMTGEVATRAAAAKIADVKRAADAAAAAFPAWSATGPSQRRMILLKAADVLASKTPQFIELMAAETGATAGWAGFNVHLAAGMLREAASMTTQISGEVIPSDKPGCIAMAIRQPAGVVLSIAPWNAPVILGVRAMALPLACGNTVVLKASEICPGTHRLIAECLREAGLPPGVLNVITNAPEDAPALIDALISHPAVRRINFTGSTRVGHIIAQTAAKYLKPVLLELGGKAPLLVLDDADLDAAVAAAAFGAFMNQGQICMSTERIVVDNKVADAFVAKLATKAETLVAGDPRKGNTAARFADRRRGRRPHSGPDPGCDREGRARRRRRQGRGHADVGDGGRSRHLDDADLRRGIVRPGGLHRPRQRRRRGGAGRQRYRIRPVGVGVRPRHRARARCRQADRSPASATSTDRPCMTRRRCRSAA